jgi:hypothetical protein
MPTLCLEDYQTSFVKKNKNIFAVEIFGLNQILLIEVNFTKCSRFWVSLRYQIIHMVEGLESMTSNPVTSLVWVRSPGDALVV